ncbi:protein-tyrosine-phosphatase [Winogradskyella poriferorum]|uniref:protein-tyrosine-phosphatase n=1 Tax=Winogradskyella poriferorum TaxID=307627 RepID=UPI003D64AD0C
MYKQINDVIESLDLNSIPQDRYKSLDPMIDFIQNKVNKGAIINLNFICTHNSRRSHLSQVWAQAMATYYKINNVHCYSGGTEATALFPSAAEALECSGFQIQELSKSNNPIYSIKFSDTYPSVIGFSKTFDDSFNPSEAFAAIMTCSSADKGCPFIAGAEVRLPITFEDPKAFDGTQLQKEKYLERSLQIATNLKYVFSNLKTT